MHIYLAGGVTGNLNKFWKDLSLEKGLTVDKIREKMNIYLVNASTTARKDRVGAVAENIRNLLNTTDDNLMKLYMAGTEPRKNYLFDNSCEAMGNPALLSHINILESYYYLRKNTEFMNLVPHFGNFLLDSGAFTFMQGSHNGKIDWDRYVEEYAAFINKFNIKLFFELDIDSLVGIKEVERLRDKLIILTNKLPIPVWHKSRGKEYFLSMVDKYPYVAIGGIVTQEYPRVVYEKAFPWFIQTAHKKGVKIHGLGYTTIGNLPKYHFDSVDSTAWLYGNRGGYLYKFNPKTGLMEQIKGPANHRMKSRESAVHNFNEWVKLGIHANKYW